MLDEDDVERLLILALLDMPVPTEVHDGGRWEVESFCCKEELVDRGGAIRGFDSILIDDRLGAGIAGGIIDLALVDNVGRLVTVVEEEGSGRFFPMVGPL